MSCSAFEHDVICIGVNYRAHGEETGVIREAKFDQPDPIFFGKRAIRILGSGDEVDFRSDIDPELDYEAELAVIIGKRCKDVAKEDAESVIFGYSVFNDYSSRKLQRQHGQPTDAVCRCLKSFSQMTAAMTVSTV